MKLPSSISVEANQPWICYQCSECQRTLGVWISCRLSLRTGEGCPSWSYALVLLCSPDHVGSQTFAMLKLPHLDALSNNSRNSLQMLDDSRQSAHFGDGHIFRAYIQGRLHARWHRCNSQQSRGSIPFSHTLPVRLPLSRFTPPHPHPRTQPHSSQLQHALLSVAVAQTQDPCAQACGNSASAESISSHAERFRSVFHAQALTNCSLFALDADDFHKAADQYPGVKSKLQAWAIR